MSSCYIFRIFYLINKDVYKSKQIEKFKEIRSEDFINSFIEEYISIFDKNLLIRFTLFTIPSLFVLDILGFIIALASLKD